MFVDAVSSITSVVPSGISNVNFTLSPAFGLTGKSTVIAGGVPVGPATVAPVSDEVMALSFMPNGNGSASSAIWTEVTVGAVIASRPRPAVPMSACLALVDDLLQPGLRAGALENIADVRNCLRIRCASGEEIAIAGLDVQQLQHFRERVARAHLRHRLAGVLELRSTSPTPTS